MYKKNSLIQEDIKKINLNFTRMKLHDCWKKIVTNL